MQHTKNRPAQFEQTKSGIVFISYSSNNKTAAQRVCDYIEDEGISCWIAPRNIEPGSEYGAQIINAIRRCKVFLLIASESINRSGHVSSEVDAAFDYRKPIIPYKIEAFTFSDEFRYYLGRMHHIEAFKSDSDGKDILIATIRQNITSYTKEDDLHDEPEIVELGGKQITANDNYKDENECPPDRKGICKYLLRIAHRNDSDIFDYTNTLQRRAVFERNAANYFSATLKAYDRKRSIDPNELMASVMEDVNSGGNTVVLRLMGPGGIGKKIYMQLLFLNMLDAFREEKSNCLPIYLSMDLYESIGAGNEGAEKEIENALIRDIHTILNYIKANSSLRPVFFVDSLRYFITSKVGPENVLEKIIEPLGRYKIIVAADTDMTDNRERAKHSTAFIEDKYKYLGVFDAVPFYDTENVKLCINSISAMYEYDIPNHDVEKLLRQLNIDEIDVFILRIIMDEMSSNVTLDENMDLAMLFEKNILDELRGDRELLYEICKYAFDFIYDEGWEPDEDAGDVKIWPILCAHPLNKGFMLAYYFIKTIEEAEEKNNDFSQIFDCFVPRCANKFVPPLADDNHSFQANLMNCIFKNYDSLNILQQSNAANWLGRINIRALSVGVIKFLEKKKNELTPKVKLANLFSPENMANQLLYRAICLSLIRLNQRSAMDDYLCNIITNDVANAINRGMAVEYYGEHDQIMENGDFNLDDDVDKGERVIIKLLNDIDVQLKSRDNSIEKDIITLCTLIQMRIQSRDCQPKYDMLGYVKRFNQELELYARRPSNIKSQKLFSYIEGMQEDLKEYLANSCDFDVGQQLYNTYRKIKDIKRVQWLQHNIPDPESISEHIYSAWLMAMLFLPEEVNEEDYCKREVLDMLLIHDLAEAKLGDQVLNLNEPRKELAIQNKVLRRLFLKGTYPDIANLSYYYNIWTGYYNGTRFNARLARDVNLVQTVYTFCEYYHKYPEAFCTEDLIEWMAISDQLETNLGDDLFKKLIQKNPDFVSITLVRKG